MQVIRIVGAHHFLDGDPIYGSPADSWKRANTVQVESDHVLSGVSVELPGS